MAKELQQDLVLNLTIPITSLTTVFPFLFYTLEDKVSPFNLKLVLKQSEEQDIKKYNLKLYLKFDFQEDFTKELVFPSLPEWISDFAFFINPKTFLQHKQTLSLSITKDDKSTSLMNIGYFSNISSG